MSDSVKVNGLDDLVRAVERFNEASRTIEKAAQNMNDAAEKMRAVLRDFDYTITCHQRFMGSWVENLRNELEDILPVADAPLKVRVVTEEGQDVFSEIDVDWEESPRPSTRSTVPSPGCLGEELVD
jgi:hypothetical protein